MIKKKWLKIALAVFVFVAAGLSGTVIEKFERDRFVVETVTDKAEINSAQADVSGVRADGKININTARKEELVRLSGIGEKIAQRIIDYRDEHGEFTAVEELMLVKGIGSNTLDEIRDKICVE